MAAGPQPVRSVWEWHEEATTKENMSIRALYIFLPSRGAKKRESVIFARQYSTVERQAKKLQKDDYEELPDSQAVCSNVICELQLNRSSSEFIKEVDSCKFVKNKPVWRLPGCQNVLGVAIHKNDLVFCAVPLIENVHHVKDDIDFTKLVCLSVAYTVLHSVADLVGAPPENDEAWHNKILELQHYLSISMPFGTPLELNPGTVKCILGSKNLTTSKTRMPAWRPSSAKGKQTINFHLEEYIRAVQHGKGHIKDVWEIYGSIKCKVDVEGAPDISLTLMAPVQSTAVDQVVYHPCVMLSDDPASTVTGIDHNVDVPFSIKALRLCPPLDQFTLCHYKAELGQLPLPIQAYYQMKMDDLSAKILVQLKLSHHMKNNFEFCKVRIPFFNKSPIKSFDFLPPSSAVSISSEKSALIWNIGQRFPKSLEVSLEGSVEFDHKQPIQSGLFNDPFCTGMNSFLQISFQVADFTLSGLRIDSRSVTLLPRCKVKTSCSSELFSAEYKVWNSHGDTIYAPKPTLV